MSVVVLYGRPGCCLCDDARALLERVRADLPFELVERDIERDEALLRAYLEQRGVRELTARASSRGSTSPVNAEPFTVTVICTSAAPGPAQCPAQCARGELTGQVPLVIRGAPLIGGGPAVLGGDLTGPGEALFGDGRAPQELLGRRRGELARADRGESDPGIGDHAV